MTENRVWLGTLTGALAAAIGLALLPTTGCGADGADDGDAEQDDAAGFDIGPAPYDD